MAARTPRKRIAAALDALEAAPNPLARLDAARRLREAADELEAAELQAARRAGATWNDIGACYGLTKQGAQQRFRRGKEGGADTVAAARTKPAATNRARSTNT